MKKLSYFAIAMTLTVFVACKDKHADENVSDGVDTLSVRVDKGASEAIENKAKTDEVLNQSSDDELFGTDVDDAAVESATKK
ncbi:MAG: hypothetical protein ACHQFW_10795 [Chitinophagales bacterium]